MRNRSSRWTQRSAVRATRSRVCTSARPRSTASTRASSSTTRKAVSNSGRAPSCASTSAKTRSTGITLAVRTASSSGLADPLHRAPSWVRLLNEVALSNGGMLAEHKPEWLRVRPPSGENYAHLKSLFRSLELHTVCEEAHCPNVWECWGGGTATIMLMGDTCTRGCRFCAVTSGNPHGVLDLDEPKKVAMALAEMDLTYVVLTSVDRDDLEDGGAGHFAKTVREIKARRPDMLVEALIPDFQGDLDAVRTVVDSGVYVLDHNVETIERLQGTVRDRRANYVQSLKVLRAAKEMRSDLFSKSSIMLGLGETREEVLATMRDLRTNEVDIVTVGQYLRPSSWHLAVQEYVPPEVFEELRVAGESMGFAYVAAGPLGRASYRAGEFFLENVIRDRKREPAGGVHRRRGTSPDHRHRRPARQKTGAQGYPRSAETGESLTG